MDNARIQSFTQRQQENAPPITQELKSAFHLIRWEPLVLALGSEVISLPPPAGMDHIDNPWQSLLLIRMAALEPALLHLAPADFRPCKILLLAIEGN